MFEMIVIGFYLIMAYLIWMFYHIDRAPYQMEMKENVIGALISIFWPVTFICVHIWVLIMAYGHKE